MQLNPRAPRNNVLLDYIRNEFSIVDKGAQVLPMQADNHPSETPGNTNYEAVKQQVLSELHDGNYVMGDSPPSLVSPLGTVPKTDGGIRLIHDGSRPINE